MLSGPRLRRAAVVVFLAVAWSGPSAAARESSRIIQLLELREGMTAADVGAGEGGWTESLALAVGPEGRVYATEVEQKLVDQLAKRLAAEGLDNVTPVLGNQAETGLPAACCDAILLRMVYHHFQEPEAMRRSLRSALRPDGLLAIVDINPQRHWRKLTGVPARGGHGIEPEELIREMTSDGFALVARYDDWNGDSDRYCVVFRVAPDSAD